MTQFDLDKPINPNTKSGSQLADDLSGVGKWRDALLTNHAGTSRPSYADSGNGGMVWIDFAAYPVVYEKLWTGAADVIIRTIDFSGPFVLDDVAPWNASRNYAVGEYVKSTSFQLYRGLLTPNVNHNPASSPTYWYPIGQTVNSLISTDTTRALTAAQGNALNTKFKDLVMRNWIAIGNMQFGGSPIRGMAANQTTKVLVAVGAGGLGSRSVNGGVTWTAVGNMQFGTDTINAVDVNESAGVWVAVGNNGKGSRSTDSGVTWTAVGNMQFGTDVINDVKVNKSTGVWVAVGANGKGSRSTDGGVTWTALTMNFGGTHIYAVASDNDVTWVAVGSGGNGVRSISDGQFWSAIGNMQMGSNSITSLVYANNPSQPWFIAAGANNAAAYSTTIGNTWTAISDIKFGAGTVQELAYCVSLGLIVAAGSSAKASYSSDAVNWTSILSVNLSVALDIYALTILEFSSRFAIANNGGNGVYSL